MSKKHYTYPVATFTENGNSTHYINVGCLLGLFSAAKVVVGNGVDPAKGLKILAEKIAAAEKEINEQITVHF